MTNPVEFLKDIALPQSNQHIELLGYMFILVLALFVVFIGMLFWGTISSIYMKRKEIKQLDFKYRLLSKDIMEIVLFNRTAGVMFSIIPLITIILIFAQWFQSGENPNLLCLTISLIFLVMGLVLIYDYKNSFYLFGEINFISGITGIITLFVSMWMFSAGMEVMVYNELRQSDNLLMHLFSSTVLMRFVYFLLVSLAVTGSVLLFGVLNLKILKRDSDKDYEKLALNLFLHPAFAAVILIPVFMLLNVIIIPAASLSSAFFVYILAGVFLLFIAYHIIYLLYKEPGKTLAAYLLITLLCFVLTVAVTDKIIIDASNNTNYAILAADFEKYLISLRGKETVIKINAEEIYTTRCSSCHAFDRKLVGPPHNEVIPKYFGKVNQLVAFIRNPFKVNTEYPAMPNPGLKPDEARAVAEYILTIVKENMGN